MTVAIVCQSCGMPMNKPELFGTEKDGAHSADYCKYCYQDGAFLDPNETLEHMVESCVPFMENMEPDAARKLLNEQLPRLKRWQGR